MDTIDPLVPHILKSTSVASKIHLSANFYMFISPRYKLLANSSVLNLSPTVYLTL